MSRYDLVIYGVTGYTGTKILELLLKAGEAVEYAVAGRNEERIRDALRQLGSRTGNDLSKVQIIIADSAVEESLVRMAKQAKVIVNAVGPYRLYGEAVVKAAVENGASHVDVSGEPAFLESMQLKYSEIAERNGVYVVGSCGWDSIPCDLGIDFLKENFGGRLNHVETFIRLNAPAGYAFNVGTYQSLVLGIANMYKDGLGRMRRALMPDKIPKSAYRPPKRGKIWYHEDVKAYCLQFPGADKSVVGRSQYLNYHLYKDYPIAQASFTYWFYGSGWAERFEADEVPPTPPDKKVTVRCDGPDAGYICTAGCVLSAALTVLQESEKMPKNGGVFPPATAFKNTTIYKRLQKFGTTFKVVDAGTTH